MVRRLSEGSICTLERRRSGPELPLCGSVPVLHPHPARDADDGPIAATGPPALGSDGIDRCRGLEARALFALSLRERPEVPLLPRRPRAPLVLQWDKPREGCAAGWTSQSYPQRSPTPSIGRRRAWRNPVTPQCAFLPRFDFSPARAGNFTYKNQTKGRNKSWLQSNRIF